MTLTNVTKENLTEVINNFFSSSSVFSNTELADYILDYYAQQSSDTEEVTND
jgi:hypothetical protein